MNSRSKKKDLHDVTEYKYGPYYKYAIGYLDVEVYLSHNTYEEASQTLKNLIEIQFSDMPLKMILKFLEKSVTFWLISLCKPVKLPRRFVCYLPNETYSNKCKIKLSSIIQGLNLNLPCDLLLLAIRLLEEIRNTDSMYDYKSRLIDMIYNLIVHLITYGSSKELLPVMLDISMSSCANYIDTKREIEEIYKINSIEDLQAFQLMNHSKPLQKHEI